MPLAADGGQLTAHGIDHDCFIEFVVDEDTER
jgi:hypothetical protein